MAEHISKDSWKSNRPRAEELPTLPTEWGQRLGGVPIGRGQDTRKAIADAATKRLKDAEARAAEERRTLPTQSGQRLEGISIDQNQDKSRKSARSMAEEPPMLPPEWGQRLGGDGVRIGRGQARRKAIADAVSKRLSDAKACASGTEYGRATVEEPMNIDDQKNADDEAGFWACGVCTLVNLANNPCCDACGTERSGGMNWTDAEL
ncbi:hypothetical protein MMC29_000202 [Sticta canariensis]|nr:hypothetical protein [Sticta canariensis]